MKKFSIVIPVYNVEKYLKNCLDSCLNQDIPHSDYEIIVVNDGSPDNSQAIIEEYAAKYDNIISIVKENGGLSSARNAGLKVAKGEYVWFVDSDDWVESELAGALEIVEKTSGVDVFCFDTHAVSEEGAYMNTIKRGLTSNSKDDALSLFKVMKFPFSAVQFSFWRRSFLLDKKLSFKEGALYDDWQFILRAYAVMSSSMYIDKVMYSYRIRGGTISTSKKTFRNLHDCVETACDYIAFSNDNKLTGDNAKMMRLGVCCMLNDVYRLSLKDATKVERKEYLDYFFSKTIWLPALKQVGSIKNWIAYLSMLTYYKLKI